VSPPSEESKMTKKLTCIECPVGCALSVDIESCKVVAISGHKCPKGEKYAISEVENPLRILTSAVLAEGLPLRVIPVRTDNPIPKAKIIEAMAEIKRIKINKPVAVGEVIARNFLGLNVNLIATRDAV
jgi:CxxC motif-containing protein